MAIEGDVKKSIKPYGIDQKIYIERRVPDIAEIFDDATNSCLAMATIASWWSILLTSERVPI